MADYGFGTSTNVTLNVGIALYMCLGIGMPTSEEDLETTSYWTVPYLVPIPFALLNIFLALYIFRQDSVVYHVMLEQKNKAMEMIASLYPQESQSVHEQVWDYLS